MEPSVLSMGHSAPPSTILVVDDNPVNLQILVRTLDGGGHRILAARSGKSAMQIARQVRPDLMLLDVMMPDMGGFAVCTALKSDPLTKQIAVIFLSALGDVEDKVAGLRLGAVDYITKPIQPEEVQVRVANHLIRLYLERELRDSRDRLDRELAKAARLQRQLLPTTLPLHEALRFGTFYRTSRHAGGDYYDVLDLGSGRFAIVVADASGHGASAAIVMAMVRSVLHTRSGSGDDPGAVLGYIHRHFEYLWDSGTFATAIYAVLDAARGTLRIASAGHPAPLLVRAGAPAAPLPIDATTPLFFSVLRDIQCVDHKLERGDRLLFYTDGVTDRENAEGTPFEIDRLLTALDSTRAFPPKTTIDYLVGEIDTFAAGREADDDQTLVLVGYY